MPFHFFDPAANARSDRADGAAAEPRSRDSHWAIEVVVLFSLVLLAASASVGTQQLSSISPHPFWIPVILLAGQHGMTAGVVAALTAMALYWLVGMPTTAGGEDLYDYLYRVCREPMLWLVTAVVIGGFRGQQVEKAQVLSTRLGDAEVRLASIGDLAERLRAHCEELERRIACSADRSVDTGLAALEAVRRATHEELAIVLPHAMELLVGPTSYAILTQHDGRLTLSTELSCIRNDTSRLPAIERLPESLEAELAHGRKLLSIRNAEDLELLAGVAMMAAPILTANGNRLAGVLLIQTMDPMRLDPRAERNICFLCSELGYALGKDRVVVNFQRERLNLRAPAADEQIAPLRMRDAEFQATVDHARAHAAEAFEPRKNGMD